MKINHNKWGRNYATPYISIIVNDDNFSIHFVILNHHWWIVFKK